MLTFSFSTTCTISIVSLNGKNNASTVRYCVCCSSNIIFFIHAATHWRRNVFTARSYRPTERCLVRVHTTDADETRHFCLVSSQFRWVLSRLQLCIVVFTPPTRQDKTALSRPRRRCEQAIKLQHFCLSLSPSVCTSVTRRYCVKMNERMTMPFSLSGSHAVDSIVFDDVRARLINIRYSQGITPVARTFNETGV